MPEINNEGAYYVTLRGFSYIPISGKFNAWDNLHQHSSGASFSNALKRACQTHYGHAIVAFLERLTRDKQDHGELLKTIKERFSVDGCDGQFVRAVDRFACVAFAGELATMYGVTGWEEGCATDAVIACFDKWKMARGHSGNYEKRQIIDQLLTIIERDGGSRFSCINLAGESSLPNRLGYFERVKESIRLGDDREFYFFTTGGMREALRGFDFGYALRFLADAQILAQDSNGKNSVVMRVPNEKAPRRLYKINVDFLHSCDEDL